MTHAQNQFNNGLEDADKRYGVFPDTRSEFERYQETKHLPAKKTAQSVQAYTPPETPTIEPYKSPAHAIFALVVALAPPVVGIVAVGGILWIVVAACAAAVGAVTAFISAYALPIGGGITALVFLVLAVFGAKAGSEVGSDSGSAAKPSGQNVNININVAGGTVTTNTNQK